MKFLGIFVLTLILFIIGCGEKMPLPSVLNSPDSFGANDTSYIHLTPDWTTSTIGYFATNPMRPVDITIGDDGYLFVADENNDRVITLTKSGELATHQGLYNISPIEKPIGLDINSKLNLLVVNGTNTIYVWNQFINISGVSAVAFDTTENGELDFTTDPGKIDSVLGVCPFYIDEDENSSFQGIAWGLPEDNTIFVTDNTNNRILKLELIITVVADVGRHYFPLFSGLYIENIA